jgi:hypothetical protein
MAVWPAELATVWPRVAENRQSPPDQCYVAGDRLVRQSAATNQTFTIRQPDRVCKAGDAHPPPVWPAGNARHKCRRYTAFRPLL